MKISIYRLLIVASALDFAAFVVAFALRHANHGAGETVGSVAWSTLLTDAPIVLVLFTVSLLHALRGRHNASSANH
jgi:hypothetical protein